MLNALIAKVLETLFSWIWRKRKVCVPLEDNFFITKSAVEISDMIRTRKVTAQHVVQAYTTRLADVNHLLNAVVDGPFTIEALAEARAIDERLERGLITDEELARKPFLGVPFTTKDSTAVKGKLHTLGLRSRSTMTASEDAECVRLMKEAGAIIIATSNVPEINRWFESRNNLVGQTNNPYDHRRTPGGSSGGEGALISSCGSCIGIGTDIGGSIRIPAFNCGIFGHKPTNCAVNIRGCTMKTGDETDTMVSAGPMSRHATDLLPLMKVLVDGRHAARLQLERKVDVRGLRFFYCDGLGDKETPSLSTEMANALQRSVSHLETITGRVCERARFSGMERAGLMYRHRLTQEPQDFRKLLPTAFDESTELRRMCIGRSEYTVALLLSAFKQKPVKNPEAVQKAIVQLKEELETFLGDDGILLFPSSHSTAAFHYAAFFQVYKIFTFSLFNVLRLPVTQVPLGLDSKGLPLGIQIVGPSFNDRHCIAVAEELERAFGGWVPPFHNAGTGPPQEDRNIPAQ